MDHMLPSPGFSIPSIGTPIHQQEEDQQIIENNPYYAQHLGSHNQMISNNISINNVSGIGIGGNEMSGSGSDNSGLGNSSINNMGLPSLMNTPSKLSNYQPSYATPQRMIQPQTPVCCFSVFFYNKQE